MTSAYQDWHQIIMEELLPLPLSETRLGPAHVKIGHHFKLSLDYFPATTAKRLLFDNAARELYCFLNNFQTLDLLHEHGIKYWDDNIYKAERKDLGKIYGYQWRKWNGEVDQIDYAIHELEKYPNSRRAIINGWNISDFQLGDEIALPPCPILIQFNILHDKLYCSVYQRSADAFLGLPFDVAQYALLARLFANTLCLVDTELDYHISNLHLYEAHDKMARKELDLYAYNPPKLFCTNTLYNFHYQNIKLINYKYSKYLQAPLFT